MRIANHLIVATLVAQACGTPGDDGGAGPGPSDGRDIDATLEVDDGDASEASDPSADLDFDEVADGADNCPGLFNPDQADADRDGLGDVCDPENDDRDGDGVPNLADPYPDEAAWPGVVLTNTVYAHTEDELYMFGVKGQLDVALVGAFDFPPDASDARMTDIAIDRYGVMWGIGFDDVFIVQPSTAACRRIAALPQSFNGLTLIPKGVLGGPSDALIGIDINGGWWRLDLVHAGGVARVQTTFLGSYGASWLSSGDAFSIEGVGTFASVDTGSGVDDTLVTVDPATGAFRTVVASLTGYGEVWGLAGWSGRAYAFDASGMVLVIDLSNGAIIATKATGKAWWGAGVRTVLDE